MFSRLWIDWCIEWIAFEWNLQFTSSLKTVSKQGSQIRASPAWKLIIIGSSHPRLINILWGYLRIKTAFVWTHLTTVLERLVFQSKNVKHLMDHSIETIEGEKKLFGSNKRLSGSSGTLFERKHRVLAVMIQDIIKISFKIDIYMGIKIL